MHTELLTLALGLVFAGCEHEAVASRDGAAPPAGAGGRAVLVELFTSQGCSSCPPADALLKSLADEGAAVVPLAYHVDYWDQLGWPDPFGDERWTARQEGYAAAMGAGRMYTPQLLFDGRDLGVGTSKARARAAIEAAARQPEAVALELAVERRADVLEVEVGTRWADGAERSSVSLMVAVTSGGHLTKVSRGENTGRTLRGDFVVRDFTRACRREAKDRRPCRATLSLAGVERPDEVQVVAFAQDPGSWRVLGVTTR